jgi:hypothetical protein
MKQKQPEKFVSFIQRPTGERILDPERKTDYASALYNCGIFNGAHLLKATDPNLEYIKTQFPDKRELWASSYSPRNFLSVYFEADGSLVGEKMAFRAFRDFNDADTSGKSCLTVSPDEKKHKAMSCLQDHYYFCQLPQNIQQSLERGKSALQVAKWLRERHYDLMAEELRSFVSTLPQAATESWEGNEQLEAGEFLPFRTYAPLTPQTAREMQLFRVEELLEDSQSIEFFRPNRLRQTFSTILGNMVTLKKCANQFVCLCDDLNISEENKNNSQDLFAPVSRILERLIGDNEPEATRTYRTNMSIIIIIHAMVTVLGLCLSLSIVIGRLYSFVKIRDQDGVTELDKYESKSVRENNSSRRRNEEHNSLTASAPPTYGEIARTISSETIPLVTVHKSESDLSTRKRDSTHGTSKEAGNRLKSLLNRAKSPSLRSSKSVTFGYDESPGSLSLVQAEAGDPPSDDDGSPVDIDGNRVINSPWILRKEK